MQATVLPGLDMFVEADVCFHCVEVCRNTCMDPDLDGNSLMVFSIKVAFRLHDAERDLEIMGIISH